MLRPQVSPEDYIDSNNQMRERIEKMKAEMKDAVSTVARGPRNPLHFVTAWKAGETVYQADNIRRTDYLNHSKIHLVYKSRRWSQAAARWS